MGACKNVSNLNNIYSRVGSTGPAFIKEIADSTSVVFDNNDYYSEGIVLANWLLSSVATLADLKVFSNQDFKSISVDPTYQSKTDLHIRDNNSYLNSAGVATADITVDIDGEVRGTPPDIGADEYVYVPPTGVEQQQSNAANLQVYPNPSTGTVTIHYVLQRAGSITLQLVNNLGQVMVVTGTEQSAAGSYHITLDTHALGLSNGVYLLRLVTDEKTSTINLMLVE